MSLTPSIIPERIASLWRRRGPPQATRLLAWPGFVAALLVALPSVSSAQGPAEPIAAPLPQSAPVFPAPNGPAPVDPPPGSTSDGALSGGLAAPGEPPPIYVPDPLDLDGYAAIPQAVAADFAPAWPRWFAGASGLIMTRTLPAGTATMQPSAGLPTLTTSSAAASWPGGVDFQVGRWMGEQQQYALEGIYWGVYGLGTSATVSGSGIDAIPQAPGVTLAGSPASAFLADATAQEIGRADLVNDVEINWIRRVTDRPEFSADDRRIAFMWLAGFRFFELQDVLTQTSTSATLPPTPAGSNRSLLSVATNNNLYGAQVGAKADWLIAPRVRLSAVPKFMIAGNAITNTTELTTVNGSPATFAGGQPVNVHSTLGVFSWLGSVDSSVAWDVTDRWSLWVGYRVVGVGNVAQADGQWPSTLSAPAALQGIDAGTGTVIHGGFAGFQGRY